MASFKCALLLLVALIAVVSATPIPEPGWGGHHKHVVIHVPYHVHTVHHHHIEPVHHHHIKEVPVYKEVHYSKPIHGWW